MTANTIIINTVNRFPQQNKNDCLIFKPGVNVLVGPPNTGKTQWFKLIDYMFGNVDPIEEELSEEIIEKYDYASMQITIAGQQLCIERHWKDVGLVTKTILDGEPLGKNEFNEKLLSLLNIPIVHYPQGNPYGSRSWPTLSWRSLLRHIYRQQRFWNDIADKQPDSEQHACLLQFLGLAKYVFSDEYGSLINNIRKINELKLKKEQYLSMLQEISVEVIGSDDLSVAITQPSIDFASNKLQSQIDVLRNKRQSILSSNLEEVSRQTNGQPLLKLGEDLVQLNSKRSELINALDKTETRINELEGYLILLKNEIIRIERAEIAGNILSPIKITHCPACDREIQSSEPDSERCILCKRPLQTKTNVGIDPEKRLEFEQKQLRGEVQEISELIKTIQSEKEFQRKELQQCNEDITRIQNKLQPFREAPSMIVPPELTMYDMDIGRLQERVQQLNRISSSLKKRESLTEEINKIQKEVSDLERKVTEQNILIDYEKVALDLEDSMNSYLNFIQTSRPKLWSQNKINFELNNKEFYFKIGKRKWTIKLGGTTTLIFLMAYHYGLLCQTNNQNKNYPGLLLIDFPAELDDGTTVKDKENFILEPFLNLLNKPNMINAQIIAAGSSFEGLTGSNRIELDQIWK
jgi:hypothetical protein